MDSYGVMQVGDYLLSVPGAVIYIVSLYIVTMLAWGITADDEMLHYRLTRFLAFALLFTSLTTLLWIKLGVWFYVKA